MAEVFGVVASGIGVAAFAVQIGANVQRLVALWKSIRNAPQHIHDLLVEIEVLAEVLADFEAAQPAGHSVAHTPPSRRALQLCKHVAEDLRIVLDKFEAILEPSSSKGVKQRTWTAVKATFKEGEIKALLQRLERAKMTLVLAGNCSSIAQMAAFRLDQSGEIENLRNLITGLTDGSRASAPGDLPKTPAISYKLTTGHVRDASIKSQLVHRSYWTPFGPVQYRSSSKQNPSEETPAGGYSSWSYWPSSWTFLKHGLEVLGDRSLGRPQFVFRTFRIVPDDSDPAFVAVKTGDLPELKRLCALGHASPFDQFTFGMSLLHHAVVHDRPEICSWLVAHGVSVDEMIDGDRLLSPLTLMAHPESISMKEHPDLTYLTTYSKFFIGQPHSERIASFLRTAKILLDATEMDTSLIKLAAAVADHPSFAAFWRVMDYARKTNCSIYSPLATWSACQSLSFVFRHLWTDFEPLKEDKTYQSHCTCELREFLNFSLYSGPLAFRENTDWLHVVNIRKFLILNLHGHDLLHKSPKYDKVKDCCHSIWREGTPLLWIFMGLIVLKSQSWPIDHAHRYVKIWLTALQLVGVDLFAYLKTEAKTDVWIFPADDQTRLYFQFVFKFGNSDKDHRVWANYQLVRLPQQNAEDSAAQMPGAWKDYDEWDAIEPTGTIGRPIDIDSEDDDNYAWEDEPESEDSDSEASDDKLVPEVEEPAEVS